MPRHRGGPPVVVDSSAWVDFLRGRRSPVSAELSRLLRGGRARLSGVVLAELLQGVRRSDERAELADSLRGVEYLPLLRETCEAAGHLGAELRARGRILPLGDLLVAATALARGWPVLATDPHFDRVPGLVLHRVT